MINQSYSNYSKYKNYILYKELRYIEYGKKEFAEVFKNLTRYRSK